MVETILLIAAIVLSFASLYFFQTHGCENLPPNAGAPLYCDEMGFPLTTKTGGWVSYQTDNLFAFLGNSVFYFIILNLGYFTFKKFRKTFDK